MSIPRSDRLKQPPVVGKWYMVPCILWSRRGGIIGSTEEELLHNLQTHAGKKWWPVWGIKHNDVEHFHFANLHYHIDPRFLTKDHLVEVGYTEHAYRLKDVQSGPINHTALISGPPKPTFRRMRCSMDHSEWQFSEGKAVIALNEAFVGKLCGSGKRGFVCPHKHFPLGSVKAINGVVTCPLHGMRIDAQTGKCIGPANNSSITS